MNLNAANQRPSQPESGTDRKANKDPSIATHSIFSYHASADTKHQVHKQNPSKADQTIGGSLFGGLNSQNGTSPLFSSKPFDLFAPLRKSTEIHATLQKENPSPQNSSANKFNFSYFKDETSHGQPKLATVNEAKPMFTFSTSMQDHPHLNASSHAQENMLPSTGEPKSCFFQTPSAIPSTSFKPQFDSTKQYSWSFQDPGLVSVFCDIPAEEYPNSKFFSTDVQNGLFLGLKLARESAAMMEEILTHQESYQYVMDSSQVKRQIEQMKRAGEMYNFFKAESIAFLGGTMAGKSSVINSLLDFPGLATADDFGSAVTSIVTEYRQMKPGQNHRIKVEVEYLAGEAMEDHVNELLWTFRRAFLPDVERDSLTAADLEQIREAWSTLETAFGIENGFSRRFLSDKSEGAFEKIASQLIKWTKTIRWPTGASAGKWASYAETAEGLYKKTRPLMQDRAWPFTKIMRVYIDAPILRAGLVIADLPGLLDTSLARVKATQDYLSKCDRVFHVTDIHRALNNQLLELSLNSTNPHDVSMRKDDSTKRWSRTAVICTKSDVIDEAGAERHLRSYGKARIIDSMTTIEDEIRKAETQKNPVLITELRRKYINQFLLEKTQNLLAMLTCDRKKLFLIEARNRRVADGLKDKYKGSQEEEDLNVFCVSNQFYGKHCSQKSVAATHEEGAISGIPALRRFCYSTIADSRLKEVKNFLLTTLPGVLGSIILRGQTLEVGPSCSITMILQKAELAKGNFLSRFGECQSCLQDLFHESVIIYAEIHREGWQRSASQKGLEWLDLSSVEYQTSCRKNGRYLNFFNEPVDWNSELIEEMRLGMSKRWNSLENSLSKVFLDLHKSIEHGFLDLKYSFVVNNFPSLMARSIETRTQDTRQLIKASLRNFEREMRGLRAKTLESNESSFILQEMRPVYRAAASIEDSDKAKALRKEVQGRIDNGTLFRNIISAVSKEMDDICLKTFQEMEKGFTGDVIAPIIADIHSVYSTITPVKKPMDQSEGPTKETLSLDMLQIKCRFLDQRYQWIMRQIG